MKKASSHNHPTAIPMKKAVLLAAVALAAISAVQEENYDSVYEMPTSSLTAALPPAEVAPEDFLFDEGSSPMIAATNAGGELKMTAKAKEKRPQHGSPAMFRRPARFAQQGSEKANAVTTPETEFKNAHTHAAEISMMQKGSKGGFKKAKGRKCGLFNFWYCKKKKMTPKQKAKQRHNENKSKTKRKEQNDKVAAKKQRARTSKERREKRKARRRRSKSNQCGGIRRIFTSIRDPYYAEYLGCYQDKKRKKCQYNLNANELCRRSYAGSFGVSEQHGPIKDCRNSCDRKGYKYFAMQNAKQSECYCGTEQDYLDLLQQNTISDCYCDSKGIYNEKHGGVGSEPYQLALYEIIPAPAPPPGYYGDTARGNCQNGFYSKGAVNTKTTDKHYVGTEGECADICNKEADCDAFSYSIHGTCARYEGACGKLHDNHETYRTFVRDDDVSQGEKVNTACWSFGDKKLGCKHGPTPPQFCGEPGISPACEPGPKACPSPNYNTDTKKPGGGCYWQNIPSEGDCRMLCLGQQEPGCCQHFWSGKHICKFIPHAKPEEMNHVQGTRAAVCMEADKCLHTGCTNIQARYGICLDGHQKTAGTVHMWPCDTTNNNQQWTYTPKTGQIKASDGKHCLDASQRNKTGGTVHMWPCDTTNKNQQWIYTASTGQIKARDGKCLDASKRNKTGGKVHMWSCATDLVAEQNQYWHIFGAGAEGGWSALTTGTMASYGQGHCDAGYIRGWDGKGTASQQACNDLCLSESDCTYAAYTTVPIPGMAFQGKSCSRYKGSTCTLNGAHDHYTFKKQQE